MAWHDDCQRVARACIGDRTAERRRPERAGDLAIAAGFAERNAPQLSPDALLECRALDVERDIERLWAFYGCDDAVDPSGRGAALMARVRKMILQFSDGLGFAVGKTDVACTLFGPRDE